MFVVKSWGQPISGPSVQKVGQRAVPKVVVPMTEATDTHE